MMKLDVIITIGLILFWLLAYYFLFVRYKKDDIFDMEHDDDFAKVMQKLWLKNKK